MSVEEIQNVTRESCTEVTKEEGLEQLERILQSKFFQGSEYLRAFLKYVVVKTLNCADDQLKEYTIATEVFGRNDAFDPRTDSVVRVNAGRLRSKLEEFYKTEGRDNKVKIDLPKGHYIPTFSYLQTETHTPAIQGVVESAFNEKVASENQETPATSGVCF